MADKMVCTACGNVGPAKTMTKGSFGLEVVLWLCFLLPGLIYSIWRLTTRHEGCAVCGNVQLLPSSSPMAQKFMRENFPEAAAAAAAPRQPGAAHSAGRALGSAVGKLIK